MRRDPARGRRSRTQRPGGDLDPEQITEGEFARRLPLPDLPDVDLLWRTGAEQRTSNFLPWHSTYTELFFTTSLWPDVNRRDLWDAIAEYARRQRRYGGGHRLTSARTSGCGRRARPGGRGNRPVACPVRTGGNRNCPEGRPGTHA